MLGVVWMPASSHAAAATQPAAPVETRDDLRSEVAELKAQVATLLGTRAQSEADYAAAADQVLSTADRHSHFFSVDSKTDDSVTASYDPSTGLIFQNQRGDFKFHPWFQLMPRYVANWREGGNAPTQSDDWQNGFEIRRMKFGFDGVVFTPNLSFMFLWTTQRFADSFTDSSGAAHSLGGSPVLEDAWAKYVNDSGIGFRVGQFKDPLSHEQLTSSRKLLAAERTYVNDIFLGGDDYVQGVTVIYDPGKMLRIEGGFTDGTQSGNENFLNSPVNSSNFGVAARVDCMVVGHAWSEYDAFTALGSRQDIVVIGAGADYTGEYKGDKDQFLHTLDAQFVGSAGLGLYAAALGRYTTVHHPASGSSSDFYDWGVVAQASYLATAHIEPFVRYDFTRFDASAGSAFPAGFHNQVHEITGGVNYYIRGQAFKGTLDGTWLPNGAPLNDDGAGILSGSKPEFLLRVQFQLLL